MQCSKCGHDNRIGAKFCEECAASLARICASCGTQPSPAAKFCPECGYPLPSSAAASRFGSPKTYTPTFLAEKILASKAALEGERKVVTVLFADLKGSTELLADRDPEEACKLLEPILEHMMGAVHRYEGTVNRVMGDGIMALFGAPVAHEDHAVRACYAALRMQEIVKGHAETVLRSEGVALRIRVGLNSGEVVVGTIASDLQMEYSAVGLTTHLAARMEQLADPGTILLAPATFRHAEGYVETMSRGPIPIKGISEPVEVFELTGVGAVRSRLQVAARRGLTRFTARESELDQLRLALEGAGLGQGQVAAVVGEPGVGKSRLCWEFLHSKHSQGWHILESRSVSYGKTSAYLPVIDLLKAFCEVEDRDDTSAVREKVSAKICTLDSQLLETSMTALLSLLGVPVEDAAWEQLDPAQRRQQTLDGVKRLLTRTSQVRPLVLFFEDLHWIDSETQALLDSLVESLPAASILLLVNYRPEYQHAWGRKTYYRQLRIDPLAPESACELLDALLGTDAVLGPLKQLLVEQTEANPLFLEESVRALEETGLLAGNRGSYQLTRPVEQLAMPATVQSILAARIDRLAPAAKRLLQAAAVIGKEVPLALLLAIADAPEHEVRAEIARLQAAEFLYEVRLFPDLEYTFKHALTQEVAYGGLLQERRRELHGRIVDAIETLHRDRLVEEVERLAYHAVRGELREKAVHYLRQAGLKAAARSALRDSRDWFEQALGALEALPESQSNS